jgi:hypothetical protein
VQNDKKSKNFFTRKGKGNRLISSRDTGQKLFIFQAAKKYFIPCNRSENQAKRGVEKGTPQKRSPSFFRTKKEGDFRSTLKMNNINS